MIKIEIQSKNRHGVDKNGRKEHYANHFSNGTGT